MAPWCDGLPIVWPGGAPGTVPNGSLRQRGGSHSLKGSKSRTDGWEGGLRSHRWGGKRVRGARRPGASRRQGERRGITPAVRHMEAQWMPPKRDESISSRWGTRRKPNGKREAASTGSSLRSESPRRSCRPRQAENAAEQEDGLKRRVGDEELRRMVAFTPAAPPDGRTSSCSCGRD